MFDYDSILQKALNNHFLFKKWPPKREKFNKRLERLLEDLPYVELWFLEITMFWMMKSLQLKLAEAQNFKAITISEHTFWGVEIPRILRISCLEDPMVHMKIFLHQKLRHHKWATLMNAKEILLWRSFGASQIFPVKWDVHTYWINKVKLIFPGPFIWPLEYWTGRMCGWDRHKN